MHKHTDIPCFTRLHQTRPITAAFQWIDMKGIQLRTAFV
jgi:hypothetical protein